MKQYLNVLQEILSSGIEKESGRANMPNTFGISKADISMDMADGFPLLTTKKMYWKGIVHELLWFLHGDTNIKYLVQNNVHVWDKDAYRWYLKKCDIFDNYDPYSFKGFVEKLEIGCDLDIVGYDPTEYKLGDLGKVYGYQWRRKEKVVHDQMPPLYQNEITIIDQVADVINSLKTNPYSRYHIINAWDKGDFDEMALPPCHVLYQFIVRPIEKGSDKFYLDLNMYQRSCDTFLGVPFNIASMSLLLHIIAKTVGMTPGIANWIGGDTHIYMDHIPMVMEQLSRAPKKLSRLRIEKELNTLQDILELTISDFHIDDYQSHPSIKAELFTGIKK